MTDSVVGVSTGTDAYLHSKSRSVGGTAVDEQIVHEGQSANPTYSIWADAVPTDTVNDHLIQIMADGTNYTRLLRLVIEPTSNVPAADGIIRLSLFRLSTAGTGGTALSDMPYDTADSYGGDMRTLPSSKGTEAAQLMNWWFPMDSAYSGERRRYIEWTPPPGGKPIIFGNGTGDGIALKLTTALASASLHIRAEVITTSYL